MREYTLLSLALAAVAAGPSVISLRDLLGKVRSAEAVDQVLDRPDRGLSSRAWMRSLLPTATSRAAEPSAPSMVTL